MISAQISRKVDLFTFQVCILVVVLAFVLSAPVLNLVLHFTLPGGNFLEKFHPAVYVLFAGFFFRVAITGFNQYTPFALHVVVLCWFILFIYLIVNDKAGYAAVVVNNYIAPLIFFGCILSLSEVRLKHITTVFLGLIFFQACLVITEFLAGSTVLPTVQEQAFFRPAGLAGHPLNAGVLAVLGMLAVREFARNYFVSRALLVLLSAEILVLGVRGSLFLAALVVLAEVIHPGKIVRTIKLRLLDMLFVGVIILVLIGALAGGALDRFSTLGLWDSSAQSRFKVFDMLNLLSDAEFNQGVPYERVGLYLEHMRLNYVESPFVAQIIAGGAGFAVAAHVLMVGCILYTFRRSKLLMLFMLFYLVSTLTFSSKTPLLFFFAFLAGISQAQAMSLRNDCQSKVAKASHMRRART